MPHDSALRYHGTSVDVRLGDVVEMRRFLRRPVRGVVCYLPGISPLHPELEYDDVRQWAIRADTGSVYPILYAPAECQPPPRIRYISRGTGGQLTPDEALE